jgi:hypothetical protein
MILCPRNNGYTLPARRADFKGLAEVKEKAPPYEK